MEIIPCGFHCHFPTPSRIKLKHDQDRTHVAVEFVGVPGSFDVNGICHDVAARFAPLIHLFVFQLKKDKDVKLITSASTGKASKQEKPN